MRLDLRKIAHCATNMLALVILPLLVHSALLEFNPPNLTFSDAQKNLSFQVRAINTLSSPAMTVSFSAFGLLFRDCQISIPANSAEWSNVSFAAVPVFQNTTDAIVSIEAMVDTSNSTTCAPATPQSFQVKRVYALGGKCTSTGDPHITTFDNSLIEGQNVGAGTFYLFKHADFEVQIFNELYVPAGPALVTITTGVAWRYATSKGTVQSVFDMRGNNQGTITTLEQNQLLPSPPTQLPLGAYTYPIGNLGVLVLNANKYGNLSYFDVSLQINPGFTNYGGLCNVVNSTANQLSGSDGNMYNITGTSPDILFVKSWQVPATEILFDSPLKISPPSHAQFNVCYLPTSLEIMNTCQIRQRASDDLLKAETKCSDSTSDLTKIQILLAKCSIGANATNLTPEQTSPCDSLQTQSKNISQTLESQLQYRDSLTWKLSNLSIVYPTPMYNQSFIGNSYTPAEISPVFPNNTNKSFNESVTVYCETLFGSSDGCTKLIDTAPFISICKSDTLLAGHYGFAQSTLSLYLSQCQTQTTTGKNDVSPLIRTKCARIEQIEGFGSNACPSNCSSNGICKSSGCECKQKYGGADCSLSLMELVSYNPQSHTYATGGAYISLPPQTQTYLPITPSTIGDVSVFHDAPAAVTPTTIYAKTQPEAAAPVISQAFKRRLVDWTNVAGVMFVFSVLI